MDKLIDRFILAALALAVSSTAGAQGVWSPATSELNFRNSLWWNTDNASALSFYPISTYGDLTGTYTRDDGDFRRSTEAQSSDKADIRASGAARVGGVSVWGQFSFRDCFERDAGHNALLYEIPEDLPFFLADTVGLSRWNKQAYSMRARISTPVLWERLAGGIELAYSNKVGAKQRDPRTTTYLYDLSIVRSLSWKITPRSLIGLNGKYERGLERSTPSNNNYRFNQEVYLLRGLGMGTSATVGGNSGLSTFSYDKVSYGGGLQYNFRSGIDLLAEVNMLRKKLDITEQPTLPRKRGSTEGTIIDASLSVLFGQNNSDKLTVSGLYRSTEGIEHQQIYVNELLNQHWESIASNRMTVYDRVSARLFYEHLFGAGKPHGYDFKAGVRLSYDREEDEYLMPVSTFDWSLATAEPFGAMQLCAGRRVFLVEASVLYGKSLGSEYSYGGAAQNTNVLDIYREEADFRSCDYLSGRLGTSLTLKGDALNFVWGVDAMLWKTLTESDFYRFILQCTFGIIF